MACTQQVPSRPLLPSPSLSFTRYPPPNSTSEVAGRLANLGRLRPDQVSFHPNQCSARRPATLGERDHFGWPLVSHGVGHGVAWRDGSDVHATIITGACSPTCSPTSANWAAPAGSRARSQSLGARSAPCPEWRWHAGLWPDVARAVAVDGCCRAVGALAFSARCAGEDEQMRLGVGIPPPSSATHPAAISGCWDSRVLCSVFGHVTGKCFAATYWQILCRHYSLVHAFIGGCFAAVVPSWVLCRHCCRMLVSSLGSCFATLHGLVYCLRDHSVVRSRLVWAINLYFSSFFLFLYVYSRLLITVFVQ